MKSRTQIQEVGPLDLSGKELDVVVESSVLGFHVYKDVWTPVTLLAIVKWWTRIRLSGPRFCDLLDAATFKAKAAES